MKRQDQLAEQVSVAGRQKTGHEVVEIRLGKRDLPR
jgi:hypothetical protein